VPRLTDIDAPPDLVARACRGEEAAQAQLYAALAPATFGLIRHLVGGGVPAEDLFQDTMMAFYERLGSYRGEAPIGAWLRRIAVTRCLMYLRSPWHRARLSLPDEADMQGGALTVPATFAAEQLDVERALATLAPRARAVVWLYEVEGYSHEEIARAFGRSVSFSKSQLARAHRKLRAWFDSERMAAHELQSS
jgi:RNA polymerase sigma factor (sigma-70 family)